jgi:hypothetical protein
MATVLDFESFATGEILTDDYKSKGVVLYGYDTIADKPKVAHAGSKYLLLGRYSTFVPRFHALFIHGAQTHVELFAGTEGISIDGSTFIGALTGYTGGIQGYMANQRVDQKILPVYQGCGTHFEIFDSNKKNTIDYVTFEGYGRTKDQIPFTPDIAVDDVGFYAEATYKKKGSSIVYPNYHPFIPWPINPLGPDDGPLSHFQVARELEDLSHRVDPSLQASVLEIAKKQGAVAFASIINSMKSGERLTAQA